MAEGTAPLPPASESGYPTLSSHACTPQRWTGFRDMHAATECDIVKPNGQRIEAAGDEPDLTQQAAHTEGDLDAI